MTDKSQEQKAEQTEKRTEGTEEKGDWISRMHSQGHESAAESERPKVSDNEGPYLNVNLPQVTNFVKWPQFHIIKSNRATQDYEYTEVDHCFKPYCKMLSRGLVFTDPHPLEILS